MQLEILKQHQKLKNKKQNDRSEFKYEFKGRVYEFALNVIGFMDQLPMEQDARVIRDQLLRSTTPALALM